MFESPESAAEKIELGLCYRRSRRLVIDRNHDLSGVSYRFGRIISNSIGPVPSTFTQTEHSELPQAFRSDSVPIFESCFSRKRLWLDGQLPLTLDSETGLISEYTMPPTAVDGQHSPN